MPSKVKSCWNGVAVFPGSSFVIPRRLKESLRAHEEKKSLQNNQKATTKVDADTAATSALSLTQEVNACARTVQIFGKD